MSTPEVAAEAPGDQPFVEGVGRFPLGHWHHNPDAPDFVWSRATSGTPLGPLSWRFQAFEGPILCFLNEIREARYLLPTPSAPPAALPVVAMWASFSLLMNRFALGPIIDVQHEMRWSRALRLDEPTVLRGAIADLYERRGRHYLAWDTACDTPAGEVIFRFTHTIIDLRGRDGVATNA